MFTFQIDTFKKMVLEGTFLSCESDKRLICHYKGLHAFEKGKNNSERERNRGEVSSLIFNRDNSLIFNLYLPLHYISGYV